VCVLEDLPGGECFVGSDCPSSFGCGSGFCLRCEGGGGTRCSPCDDNTDCASPRQCNVALNACLDCLTDADCPPAEVCYTTGECGTPCTSNANCTGQQICDEFGRCSHPSIGSQCNADAQCPGAGQCVKGYCVLCELDGDGTACQPCNPGIPCASGNQCDYETATCVQCNEDSECLGAIELCQFGACLDACFFDVDCPTGSTCNAATNRCEI
jgi:hypothetical protein